MKRDLQQLLFEKAYEASCKYEKYKQKFGYQDNRTVLQSGRSVMLNELIKDAGLWYEYYIELTKRNNAPK